MPQEYGPQQFELPISDSFTTYNPKNPSSEVTVRAIVSITVKWNLDRTLADEKSPVVFSQPRWLESGKGPHAVFEATVAGEYKQVATMSWDLVTEVLHVVEKRPGSEEFRHLITPCLRLVRTLTPTNGSSPTAVDAAFVPATCTGNWFKPPAPAPALVPATPVVRMLAKPSRAKRTKK